MRILYTCFAPKAVKESSNKKLTCEYLKANMQLIATTVWHVRNFIYQGYATVASLPLLFVDYLLVASLATIISQYKALYSHCCCYCYSSCLYRQSSPVTEIHKNGMIAIFPFAMCCNPFRRVTHSTINFDEMAYMYMCVCEHTCLCKL